MLSCGISPKISIYLKKTSVVEDIYTYMLIYYVYVYVCLYLIYVAPFEQEIEMLTRYSI